jgi:hypothetical protein
MTAATTNSRPNRLGLALLLALLAGLLAAGPAPADTALAHQGTVGKHSLRDSSSNGGVSCFYSEPQEMSPGEWLAGLRRLEVRPPKVKSSAGSQRVGWRFIVQRTHQVSPEWVVTYKSPVQKAMATLTGNAAFSAVTIKVSVPDYPVYYRVDVVMFWYDAAGRRKARHRVDNYNRGVAIRPGIDRNNCSGELSFYVE